jgi:hypothetical protein
MFSWLARDSRIEGHQSSFYRRSSDIHIHSLIQEGRITPPHGTLYHLLSPQRSRQINVVITHKQGIFGGHVTPWKVVLYRAARWRLRSKYDCRLFEDRLASINCRRSFMRCSNSCRRCSSSGDSVGLGSSLVGGSKSDVVKMVATADLLSKSTPNEDHEWMAPINPSRSKIAKCSRCFIVQVINLMESVVYGWRSQSIRELSSFVHKNQECTY